MALPSSIIQRGDRASQPAANAVAAGTLYCVTDEGDIIERSSGAAWESYSPTGGGSGDVTAIGTLTSNALIIGQGSTDVAATTTGAGILTFLGTPSSANLASAVTGETGSGALVFGTSPTIATPTISGAIAFPDDVRQTFNPGATNAGLNVGALAGDPGSPSNGDLWYDSSANELTARINGANVALGAGGGGGNSTETTAFGSETLTTAGDVDFYTNAPYVGRYTGAAWVPWGPIFAFTDPALASIGTWVNQGAASIDTTNGGVYLSIPSGAALNLAARVKSAPSAPYTITAAFLLPDDGIPGTCVGAGLCLRASGDGKLILWGSIPNSSTPSSQYAWIKMNSPSSFNSEYGTRVVHQRQGVVWMRIVNDNTNFTVFRSFDGQHWQQFDTTRAVGDFATIDQVGFYCDRDTVSGVASYAAYLVSWKET